MKTTILDIGCGSSPKGDVNCDLYRTKTPHIMEEHTIVSRKIPNFVLCDLQHLPFKDNSFDIVNASQVIEHILEPALMLKEMKRVSKGMVTLDVPNLRRLTAEQNQYHLYSWSDKTLQNLLMLFFDDVTIEGAEYASYLPSELLKKPGVGLFLELFESFIYRLFGPPFIKAICAVSKQTCPK